jgi:hypothetical protein
MTWLAQRGGAGRKMPSVPYVLSDARLRRWFRFYNDRYFGGQLEAKVSWKPVESCWAQAFGGEAPEIHIGLICGVSRGWTKLTLLHEMVHLEMWPDITHGKRFQARMKKLAQDGAMRGLW